MKRVIDFSSKKNRYYILMTVVSAIVIISLTMVYKNLMSRVARNVNAESTKLTRVYGEVFTEKLAVQKKILENMSDRFEGRDLSDDAEILKALNTIRDKGYFNSVRYYDLDGNLKPPVEADNENISDCDGFLAAKEGRTEISSAPFVISDGQNAIAVFTPVRSDGGIKGVLSGIIFPENIAEMLNLHTLEKGDLMLVDEETNIFAISSNSNRSSKGKTLGYYLNRFVFEEDVKPEDVVEDIKENNTGSYAYRYYNDDRYFTYLPVGINNWMIVHTMSRDEAYEACNGIMSGFRTLFMLILAAIAGMLALAVMIIRQMIVRDEQHSKYDMIEKEKLSVTYTYNPVSRALELEGAVEQTFGAGIASLGTVNIVTLLDMLHPDDQDIIKILTKRARDGENKFSTEVRVRNQENEYSWYKLSGIFVRNSKGGTEKVVGNIQNSDEEIAQEQTLKNKAETDLLTGLLNKITMEDMVNSVIKEKPGGIYYFYIIDLDNFKSVNDNLGHATGDNVLVDVASKLSRIFSEFDYVGRIGGDEFAVLLVMPENMSSSTNLVEVKANAILNSVRHTYTDGNLRISISSSIGISRYEEGKDTYADMYKKADKALYHCKRNGKDRYTFYSEEIENEEKEAVTINR
ncbi:MAG: diguanylate cyclase [Lachnospiraceae bacterium]|nr:diguanylate cyclase [Lachnospiraceae bacterium]